MCGICGVINFNGERVKESSLEIMKQTMKHRGPDDNGTFFDWNVGLGFVRLSIIDLSEAGHQPMFSDDGQMVIIFNGEIFNYIEIREDLKQIGYTFKTNTDTEVLLKAYIEWGDQCLQKLNGMWAFAIYNLNERTLFIARDRYGIKPFYYYEDNNKLIFASEIPPILRVLDQKVQANYMSIFDYLVFSRTDQTEATFFSGIKKLQHGHFLRIRLNVQTPEDRKTEKEWYNLRLNIKETFCSPDEYCELLSNSISLRLRSDVPVGVCLSGGLDSSSIVSLLNRDHKVKDLNTFSAVYKKGETGDESEFIDEYKSELKNMYFTNPTAETLLNDIKQFVMAQSEPIPTTSPYAQFKVMELAGKYVVVTLDGQGADETLAGYHYFFGLYFKELLLSGKLIKALHEIYMYLITHKSIYGIKTFFYFMLPVWLKSRFMIFKTKYLTREFNNKYKASSSIAQNLYNSNNLKESLLEHFEYKLEHLLKWEDRNSMWFSLEARVPYLDYRLVERTLALPSEYLIKNGVNKYILRSSMENILPEKIRLRKDKVGFGTPEDNWFRSETLRPFISEILFSESFKSRDIIDVRRAQIMYNKHLEGTVNISKEIWKWINLELWFREYID